MIIQIDVFDFDQTLFRTPHKKDWEYLHNKKWVNQDFYKSPKSFEKSLKIIPNLKIIHRFLLSSINPFIWTIIMTGRVETLKNEIKKVLDEHGLDPDALFLCPYGQKSTDFKIEMIRKFISEHKYLKKMRFFDDRTDNLLDFKKVCRDYGIECQTIPVFDPYHLKKIK